MFPGGPRGELGAARAAAGQIRQAEGLGVGLALVREDRAGPEQSLGLIQDPQGIPPRIGPRARGQPDAEIGPEDSQVQEVGPELRRPGPGPSPPPAGPGCDRCAPRSPAGGAPGSGGLGRRQVRPVEKAEAVGQLVELLGQLALAGSGELLAPGRRRRSSDRDRWRSNDRTQEWSIRARP